MNRQECLLAINRAVKKHNIQFVQMLQLELPPIYRSVRGSNKSDEGFPEEDTNGSQSIETGSDEQSLQNGSK